MIAFRQFGLILFLGTSLPAFAGSLYLPLQLSPEIESHIERLFVAADMPINKRPIPIKRVQTAVERARATHPHLAKQAAIYLERYEKSVSVTHSSLSVGSKGSETTPLPNQRGFTSDSYVQASFAGQWLINDYLALSVGTIAGDRPEYDDLYLESTFLAAGWDAFQVELGWRSHWFSPFRESAMLISSQSPAMPGVTVSNVEPFEFLGFSYEFFWLQMSESDLIESATDSRQRVSGKPQLVGAHFGFEPFSGFSIAFNRIMQFGGGNRPDSPGDVFDAFLNPKQQDNVGVEGNDFGNQATSVTTRYTFQVPIPFSVYMEYAGEDTSEPSEAHLGNSALSLGLHLPFIAQDFDFTAEFTEWQNGWYVNSNYGNGLSNEGVIIGHWGLARKEHSPAIPGRALFLGGQWQIQNGTSATLEYRRADFDNNNVTDYVTSEDFTLEIARAYGERIIGITLLTGNDAWDERYSQISGFIRW